MAKTAKPSRWGKFVGWIDERYPLSETWEAHVAKYYAPKNFNFWYYFGSLALVVLVIQILTGIFLTMHYKPDVTLAFASVEYIMRDVDFGWLIRYMHSTGASLFFVVVYLHIFRAFLYGSHRSPRELLWIIGVVIFVALMAEAFMGYLLPWGNMSYWGAQVIISLFDAIPLVGPGLAEWIRGDFVVSDATLNRFFALHVIAVPLVLIALVFIHIVALHRVGSNNPDGIEIKKKKNAEGLPADGIPFHPYYTVKDLVGTIVFLMVFAVIVFFIPEMFGWFLEHDNFTPANILQTPTEIKPLWYFTPFYSILRATTADMVDFRLVPLVVAFAVLVLTDLRSNLARVLVAVVVGMTAVMIASVILALLFGVPMLPPTAWGLLLIAVSLLPFLTSPWFERRKDAQFLQFLAWILFGISFIALIYFYLYATSEAVLKFRSTAFVGIVLAAAIASNRSLLVRFVTFVIASAVIAGFLGIEAKFWGVVLMGLALGVLLVVPWLDRSAVKSIRYRGWMYKTALAVFTVAFIVLGYLGTQPASGAKVVLAQAGTVIYFLFFLLMPWYTTFDKTKRVPERVTS